MQKKMSDVMNNHRTMSYLAKLIESCSFVAIWRGEIRFKLFRNICFLIMVNKSFSKYYIYFIIHRYLINKPICLIPSSDFSPLGTKEVV